MYVILCKYIFMSIILKTGFFDICLIFLLFFNKEDFREFRMKMSGDSYRFI